MSKGSTKTSKSKMNPIVLIVICFVAVLAGSIGIQMILSPDFKGFGGETVDPVITYVESGVDENDASDDGYNWQDHPVLIVGDSLTQGANSKIANVLPDATIDGKVNRNMTDGLAILQGWDEAGLIPDDAIIVVCLANNITGSTVNSAQAIVDMIKPGQSLIMMTGHGLSNMATANEFIRNLPNQYSFVTAADWDLTISQSPGLLSSDGIHIASSQGNEVYADLILRALEVSQPKE